MKNLTVIALIASLMSAGHVSGQEEPEPPVGGAEPAAEAEQPSDSDQEAEPEAEALPELDVWAEDGDSDEDVFIPSESISADASIAFPTDI